MVKHELCCIGHITHDKIVTPKRTAHMPGGTSYYFSHAIRAFKDIDFNLITALGNEDMKVVDDLRGLGISVEVMPSKHSVYFENIYGENQDNRTQRVLAKADPFTVDFLRNAEANIFHLGSLLADDFSLEVVRYLSQKGRISIDSQGYLREVRDTHVYPVDWTDKRDFLQYVYFLKANEQETLSLTGTEDVEEAAKMLHSWGVKEILLTLGSNGSVIYDGKEFHLIPAYKPVEVVDATGCGDTYMTGYLYCREKNMRIDEAGRVAAAISTLKIEKMGPFSGTKEDIEQCMAHAEQTIPQIG